MNTTTLQIHIAASEDINELVIIYEEARIFKHSLGDYIWGDSPFTADDIRKMVEQKNLYIATIGGQRAGAFMLTWKDTYIWGKDVGNDGQAGYIHLLVTRNKFRGQEVGQKIVD